MKKEDLFKLLNQGKRDVYEVKKPKNYTLKTILYKYTGRKVLKAIESVVDG